MVGIFRDLPSWFSLVALAAAVAVTVWFLGSDKQVSDGQATLERQVTASLEITRDSNDLLLENKESIYGVQRDLDDLRRFSEAQYSNLLSRAQSLEDRNKNITYRIRIVEGYLESLIGHKLNPIEDGIEVTEPE